MGMKHPTVLHQYFPQIHSSSQRLIQDLKCFPGLPSSHMTFMGQVVLRKTEVGSRRADGLVKASLSH